MLRGMGILGSMEGALERPVRHRPVRLSKWWVNLVVVVAVALALSGALGDAAGAAQPEPARDATGALVEAGRIPVNSVRVGDCFDDPSEEEARTTVDLLSAVPCDRPHDNEAYHLFELPEGRYPGDEEVESLAAEGCVRAFEAYVGVSYDESQLESSPISPGQEAWNDGDRKVICFTFTPSGAKLTGSVRGRGSALDDVAGTASGTLSPLAAVVLGLVFLAFLVLQVAALWRIFTKAGEAGWKSLIPIWNIVVLFRIVDRPLWWLLLFLVPFVNIVVAVILYVDLAKAFGKGIGFALGMIFLGIVFLPILAFGDAQYRGRLAS